jgi:hypothetical protein
LLLFIEGEIARQGGGGSTTLHADQLAVVGSVRVVLPGLSELHGLGLIDWRRYPKRHVIALSDRWHDIETPRQAMTVSATARTQRMPLSHGPCAAKPAPVILSSTVQT